MFKYKYPTIESIKEYMSKCKSKELQELRSIRMELINEKGELYIVQIIGEFNFFIEQYEKLK